MKMKLKEVYDSTLLNIYNNAIHIIKIVDVDEFKKELVVNYIKLMNNILLTALIDENVTVSDFNYLVLQATDLSNELLKYVNDEFIFI
jgi:hypothetical protein|nr:MAG TPA: hypothetical protein [Caudoviricetes sp.]